MNKYMESDDELVKLKSKVEYIQDIVIDFLDSTIKQISNRGFQIKNVIDWRKFTSERYLMEIQQLKKRCTLILRH